MRSNAGPKKQRCVYMENSALTRKSILPTWWELGRGKMFLYAVRKIETAISSNNVNFFLTHLYIAIRKATFTPTNT